MLAKLSNDEVVSKSSDHKSKELISTGPSLYEVEYLQQLKCELQVFLRSRNFSTIQEFQLGFAGAGYSGLIQVKA